MFYYGYITNTNRCYFLTPPTNMCFSCTWHSHPRRKDLIHVRLCDDNIATADGADHTATCIGSLPVWAYDSDGVVRTVVF